VSRKGRKMQTLRNVDPGKDAGKWLVIRER